MSEMRRSAQAAVPDMGLFFGAGGSSKTLSGYQVIISGGRPAVRALFPSQSKRGAGSRGHGHGGDASGDAPVSVSP